MNKSTLATIFGAALLGIAKSKRYSLGSLGLKRNRPLEEFDKWLKESTERLMSYMENDSDFFEDLDWDADLNAKLKKIDPQHLSNAPITLMQNIAEYGLFQETPADISLLKNLNNCKKCPEAWVYYLLYISITYDIGEDITSFSPDEKDRFSGDPILVSWEKFQKNAWQKEEVFGDSLVECRDYVELSIAQIDALKKISTLNEESTSEKIILDLQNFLNKAEEKLKGVTIERSILATSIVGYCYIQILRFQISVASDKNIAEMAKKSFSTLISKNSLQKFRIWGEYFWGFPDIPMGGLKLFSVGNLPSRNTSALRAARMPLFGKMNYLDFYSISIFKRISSEITDENFRKLRLLYSSRGISLDNRWKRNETPSEKISIFFRSLKNNNILNLAENIFSAVSTIIDEGYTSDIGTDIYDGYCEFNGMLDSLQEEAIGKELDYYPHDNTFGSYLDSRLHSVIKILGDHNNEWNGGFTISLVEDYFSLLKEFSNHFQEVNYSSIDEAIENYFAEEQNAAYLEFEQLEGSSLPNRFLSDKIRLSKHDEMIAQLPIDEVLFDQDSEDFVPIKRILLVEYKDPKTLESITRNTAGELCVGRQGMRYMRSLADGSQRHFGILAQTDDGVSVMYHTHYMGENITPSQFTNFNNTEGISEKNSEHENILRQAKRILDQRVKRQQ